MNTSIKQINPAGEVQYRVPRTSGRWSGLLLALAVHAVLLLFLWIGVRWQNNQPVAVEAEVWDMKTQAAAPPPPPVAAELPEPVKESPVTPAPAPAAAAPPTPAATEAAAKPVIDPEIALERQKRKAKARELAAERVREQAAEQAAATALANAQAKAREQAEAKAEAQAQAKEQAKEQQRADAKAEAKEQARTQAAAKLKQELADKKLAEKLADKLAEKKLADKLASDKKLAEKLSQAKKAAEEQKTLDQARQLEMNRITSGNGSGNTGTAQKSTGSRNDSSYAAAITAKIKSNIAYSGSTDVAGNPRAVYKIDQLPTGEIISVKKIKSSGIPAYDRAVENAIDKSSPLPQKKDGTVTREVEAVFDMKDLP